MLMDAKPSGPQRKPLFRVIKFLTRFQVTYHLRTMKNPYIAVSLFTISAGAVALGILTAVAYLTSLPMVFPPLAASTFIIFHRPLAERACPRNIIISHMVGLIAGLSSLLLFLWLFPESNILNAWVVCWPRVAANVMAMALVCAGMLFLKCAHSPAAVTAIIASTGYLVETNQVIGFVAAVVLIVLEAILFNRVLGGIPYPLWGYNQKVAEDYKELTDMSEGKGGFWGQVVRQTLSRR